MKKNFHGFCQGGTYLSTISVTVAALLLCCTGMLVSLSAKSAKKDVESKKVPLSTAVASAKAEPLSKIIENTVFPAEKYDYTKPIPENTPVEDAYFKDDTVFIGDSRTYGLMIYGGVESRFYCSVGLSITGVSTKALIEDTNVTPPIKRTILDTLKEYPQFKKVYISFGLNEIGWPYPKVFIEKYEKVIDEIQEIMPKAQIYVEAIFPIEDYVQAGDQNNKRIREFNALLLDMASRKEIYYLDCAEPLTDKKGNLISGAGMDGIHLNVEYSKILMNYIKSHTVALPEIKEGDGKK